MISEFRGKSQFRLALLAEEANQKYVTFIAIDWDLAIYGRLVGHHLKLSLGSKALYVGFISYTQRTEPLKHLFEDLMDLLASRKS